MSVDPKKQAFLKEYVPLAQALERFTLGAIPASLTLGQAAVESNWGTSGLAKNYNNIFGVKGKGDMGTAYLPTTEEVNGKNITVMGGFAHYSSKEQSFLKYASTLSKGIYGNAFKTNDSVQMIKAIASAGYATNSNYASDVGSTILANNFKQYDGAYTVLTTSSSRTTGNNSESKDKSLNDPKSSDGFKVDGLKALADAGESPDRQSVVDSVFGDVSEGENWREIANSRENALNPNATVIEDTAEIASTVGDFIQNPVKAASLVAVKVLIIVALIIILAVVILKAFPVTPAQVAKKLL